jgi:cell division septation protein DedD
LVEEEKTERKEYCVQVGAWDNRDYAQHYLLKVKKYYPEVYIEIQNDLYLVRIPGVMTKMQGAKISKNIEDRFKLRPLLLDLNKR